MSRHPSSSSYDKDLTGSDAALPPMPPGSASPRMSAPRFEVHSPDGEEEKPMFDEEAVVPLVELPPPPDGGWGWVICFASFMCNLGRRGFYGDWWFHAY